MNTNRREFLKAGSLLALASTASLADTLTPATTSGSPNRGPGKTLQINGVRYHVLDQGRSDKVVLLLHGMPDTSQVWRHQLPALLQAGFRVIAPDMLGYGESDKPKDPSRYSGEKILGDLVGLLDALGLKNVDVVGHDWGAYASWELALNFPERFRRHVALSVGHPDAILKTPTIEDLKTSWYMYFNTLPGTAELYAANDGAFLKHLFIPTHPEVAEVWSRMKDPRAMNGMLNWDRANPMSSLYLEAAKGSVKQRACSVPTLGIWSSGDVYLWESQMRESAQSMTAAWRYVRVEKASHWLMLDQPDPVNTAIVNWLQAS